MWVLCICGNLCVNIDFYFMCAHSAVQMASNMHTMPHTHTLTYCTQSCQAEMCKTNIEWCSSVWQRNENEENRKRLHIMSELWEGKKRKLIDSATLKTYPKPRKTEQPTKYRTKNAFERNRNWNWNIEHVCGCERIQNRYIRTYRCVLVCHIFDVLFSDSISDNCTV